MKMPIKSVVLSAVALTFCLLGGASAQTLKTDAEIEAMGYTHIYSLSIPNTPNFKKGAPYSLDNSNLDLGPIESVAYRLNLGDGGFCYTSFGAYTSDLTKIGVPTFASQTVVQRYVQNLYYEANSPNLKTTGTTVTQGNIEFWPWNYTSGKAMNISGADGGSGNRNYDFDDTCSNKGSHGCMQVHDYTNQTTVFAINRFNDSEQASLGIGNCPNDQNKYGSDWTMKYNSASFLTKQLDVFAKPVFSQMSALDYAAISGEVSNMKLVYKLDCPLQGRYSVDNYQVNNATNSDISGMPLSRVGYYMVMEKADGSVDYAYASFEATTNDLTKIGLPLGDEKWYHQQTVSNMTVQSNVPGVVNGKNIATGNIEIWNTDYSKSNAIGITNADKVNEDYDFGDTRGTGGNYSCFQIHNYGESQTIMALNRWNGQATGAKSIDMGIGTNTGSGSPDYTFNGNNKDTSNASKYETRSLYVLAQAAIAPEMKNVPDASKYVVVQGARLTSQMTTPWTEEFGGVDYDIVNNVAQLQNSVGPLERVGYYMEYAKTADEPLTYVFVSFNAMTNDISKIGVPTVTSGEKYQQKVYNLQVTTNVPESDGLISSSKNGPQVTANSTVSYNTGYMEFWPNNYTAALGNDKIAGSGSIFDINDTIDGNIGHGSMQIHSLDTEQTIFALNGFNQTKQFGIGTNPEASANNSGSQADWTHDTSKSGYAIANIYTFAKPVLGDMDAEHFNAIKEEASNMRLVYKLDCPLYTSNGKYSDANYTVNNLDNLGDLAGMPLKRVAYYMTLEKADGSVEYAYASYDSLTNDPAKIGMPFDGSIIQTKVNNLTVSSNVDGVKNGTGLSGNIEMWNRNYGTAVNADLNISGADGSKYDFCDTPATDGGSYACFQIHNYGEKKTVMALNAWNGEAKSASRTIDIGIGNNQSTQQGGHPDYTFNGKLGVNSNASQYVNRSLYVMAERAIAPGMEFVSNASDYTLVQGARLTTQMTNNWHNDGIKYDIVDNLASLQSQGVLFDRVGYYMEYAQNASDQLTYVFVSFDAMTTDISKIGVPISSTGEYYQQYVNNLEVTTNVTASQGRLNDPSTKTQAAPDTTISHEKGYIEFCASNYSNPKGGVNSLGSSDIYDINDYIGNNPTGAGHGSMQIHSIDTQQTIFALNNFKGKKQYGIGTNPNPSANSSGSQSDWTFDETRANYAIANIYTFVHEVDALLTTNAMSMYQRDLANQANVTLSGTWAATNGVVIDTVQASVDGGDWFALTMNSDGTFTGTTSLMGGLHDVAYQAVDVNGNVVATKSGQVGVGEIFITAGQSNSTNCGDAPQVSTSSLAFSYNPRTGQWQRNEDPQQGTLDGTQKGSTWPSFADTLSAEEGIPVATYSVGYSGTKISEWIDDSHVANNVEYKLYSNLKKAMSFLNGKADGFAGILWHQGESDKNTSEQDYYNMLCELIARTRADSGNEDLPWGVAIASADAAGNIYENVTSAQLQVIENDPLVFLGVNTDEFFIIDSEHASDPDYQTLRGTNGNSIHLSDKGLKEAGRLWALTAGESIVGLRKYWRADSAEAVAISDWEVNGGYKLGIKLVSGEALSVETPNNVQMLNDGTIEVGENYNLTLTGNLSGSGELEKTGKGAATFSGDSSGFSGKTKVSEGTLTLSGNAVNANGSVEVASDAILVYHVDGDDSKQLTFSDDVTLTGGNVIKTGTGKLKIKAAGTQFSVSQFSVDAGELDFHGDYNGNLEVQDGATLSAGNSPGDLTVNGDVTIDTGATGLFEFSAFNADKEQQVFDRMFVTGASSFTLEPGSTIKLSFLSGDASAWATAEDPIYQLIYDEGFVDDTIDMNEYLESAYQSMFDLQGTPEGLFLIGHAGPIPPGPDPGSGVPEPSTWTLMILGALGLLYWRKRK